MFASDLEVELLDRVLDDDFKVEFRSHASSKQWIETGESGRDASEKALAFGVLKVFEIRICRRRVIKNYVLDQKSESGQHAVALSPEGTGVAASGGTASFPENLGWRGQRSSKGS
jgi:hypothetical protein